MPTSPTECTNKNIKTQNKSTENMLGTTLCRRGRLHMCRNRKCVGRLPGADAPQIRRNNIRKQKELTEPTQDYPLQGSLALTSPKQNNTKSPKQQYVQQINANNAMGNYLRPTPWNNISNSQLTKSNGSMQKRVGQPPGAEIAQTLMNPTGRKLNMRCIDKRRLPRNNRTTQRQRIIMKGLTLAQPIGTPDGKRYPIQ